MNSAIVGLLISAICCEAAPHPGNALAHRDDGVAALNEPCYVHDGACNGYPVCCVTVGTCISKHSGTVSSNTKYYEGGCQSFDSSKKEYNERNKNAHCKQQGECTMQFLETCMGGTTKPGLYTEVPKETMDRFMEKSCETACPKGRRGGGHYSRGGKTNGTTTTTTTTTVITQVTESMYLAISDVSAVNATAMGPLVIRTIAAMAGFGTDHSMLDVEMPETMSATMKLTAHFDVTNLHKVKPDEVKTNIAAHSVSAVNAMFAGAIGTCPYTVTMIDEAAHTAATAPSDATSAAHGAHGIIMGFMGAAAVIVA